MQSLQLRSTLTRDEWLDNMYRKSKSYSTKNNARLALRTLDNFCLEKYGKNADDILVDLKNRPDDSLYIFLNNLVGFMDSSSMSATTIRTYFSNIKSYLRSQGIKTDPQDLKNIVNFPKLIRERRKELSLEIIRTLLNNALPRKRALYLTLLSSGMRLSEALTLRKEDLDLTKSPVLVRIRAENTKTREARETFISKEAKEALLPILKEKGDHDLIFTKNENIVYAKISEESYFQKLRSRCGFSCKYSNKRNYLVNMHAFRAYFHTKASLKHGTEYANALDGHTGYLEQYYRISEEQRSEMYKTLEPSLLIYSTEADNQTEEILLQKDEVKRNEQAIETLREKYEHEMQAIRKELAELRRQNCQDCGHDVRLK